MDAHGGSGPGQTSGGHAGLTTDIGGEVDATAGASKLASGRSAVGGDAWRHSAGRSAVWLRRRRWRDEYRAWRYGVAERARGNKDIVPERGSLGSGGGGGVGNASGCQPGARGGHGYIALRPI